VKSALAIALLVLAAYAICGAFKLLFWPGERSDSDARALVLVILSIGATIAALWVAMLLVHAGEGL